MMRARRDDFDERFGDHLEELSAKSAQRLGQFETASAAHYNAVDQALASQSRRIETSLGDGLARFEGAIDGRGRDLVATDRRPVGRARQRSRRQARRDRGDARQPRAARSTNRLGRRNEETAALFDSHLQTLDERAEAKLREVSGSLEALLARIEDGLAQRGRTLSETLARNTLETARALGEGGRELASGHGRQVGRDRRDAAEARQRADADACRGSRRTSTRR